MTGWVKIEETWLESEVVETLSAEAIVMHISALADCARHLRNGRLPTRALRRLWPVTDVAGTVAQLEAAGLWEPTEDGWYLPTWHDHILSAVEVEHRRQASRDSSERYRRHKAGDHSMCERCAFVKRGDTSRDTSPDQSRDVSVTVPDPIRSDPKGRRGEEVGAVAPAGAGAALDAETAYPAHPFRAPVDDPDHCSICGHTRAGASHLAAAIT